MSLMLIPAASSCLSLLIQFPLSPAVQHECIPQAILGMDILCQAKSGMGKTAVFVLSTLQQVEPVDGEVSVVVLCHTRELAYQVRTCPALTSRLLVPVLLSAVRAPGLHQHLLGGQGIAGEQGSGSGGSTTT
jgi:hypothetical protein